MLHGRAQSGTLRAGCCLGSVALKMLTHTSIPVEIVR